MARRNIIIEIKIMNKLKKIINNNLAGTKVLVLFALTNIVYAFML
ncbi:MAG: hypothetical protein ACI85Q_002722, partial [Salibacteraceae bacterium]